MEREKLRRAVGRVSIISCVLAAGVAVGEHSVWETITLLSMCSVFYGGCIWWMLRDNKTKAAE